MKTYSIAIDGQSITCNLCGMRSYNRNDIEQRYCGHCHRFHEEAQDATLEQLYAKMPLSAEEYAMLQLYLERPSLWRRYCNWFGSLPVHLQWGIIVALSIIAALCILDFVRKVIL